MEKIEFKNLTDTSADFYVYGDIVDNSDWRWDESDVMPNDVQNLLDQVKGKDLNVFINSGGGSLFSGMAIYSMLKRHDAKINVHVDGLAGSIASVIAMAGDTITIPSNAFLMIHKPWSMTAGNADEMRKMADTLDRLQEGIMNVYTENLAEGVDSKQVEDMVNAETWLTGIQAKEVFKNVVTGQEIQAVACTSNYFKDYTKTPKELLEKKENKIINAIKNDIPVIPEAPYTEETTAAPFFDIGDRVKIQIPHAPEHVFATIREANLTYAYGVVIDGLESEGIYHWYVESEINPNDEEEDDDETETPEQEQQEETAPQNKAKEIAKLLLELDIL